MTLLRLDNRIKDFQSTCREEVAMNRRSAMRALAGIAAVLPATQLKAGSFPPVLVYRTPSCSCCEKWKGLIAAQGFDISMEEDADLAGRAASLGIPETLQGCHSGTVGDYVISAHIPPDAIIRLLREQPRVKGLSVPGMAVGSPGMEAGTRKGSYEVVAFRSDGSSFPFARH